MTSPGTGATGATVPPRRARPRRSALPASVRRRWAGVGGQDGSVTLSTVVVFPAVLALILLGVQAGLLAHARDVARSAATEGLRSARLYGSTAAAGEARARTFLDETARGLITDTTVRAERGPSSARVQVSGRALSLLPGVNPTVRAEATGPVETFTPQP